MDNLNVVRVNSSALRIKWTDPVNLNGVFQMYRVNVSIERSSIIETFYTNWPQLSIVRLG